MLHHPTVTYIDWLFVPFNYLAAKIIDWKRGLTMYILAAFSSIFVIATHALWQRQAADAGHMITKSGVVLPAGWVHIAFSIVEMVLLVAFVFCRRRDAPLLGAATSLAAAYFVAVAICGYILHHGIILSDGCAFVAGLFFVLLYPRLRSRTPSLREV